MAWVYLFAAGLLEIVWAIGLKYSEGFTRPGPSAITLVALVASLLLLALALKGLPIGTAYAVWTGIGTLGTVIFGIVFFAESADMVRLACIGLIVIGLVGLKLVTP